MHLIKGLIFSYGYCIIKQNITIDTKEATGEKHEEKCVSCGS